MSGETPEPRMSPGLGAIQWQDRIVCYQMNADQIAWARPLGEACIEVTPELKAAIEQERRKR
jgi:hypothetical protein